MKMTNTYTMALLVAVMMPSLATAADCGDMSLVGTYATPPHGQGYNGWGMRMTLNADCTGTFESQALNNFNDPQSGYRWYPGNPEFDKVITKWTGLADRVTAEMSDGSVLRMRRENRNGQVIVNYMRKQ